MKSIRVFLVTVILAVITLFNFMAALKGYQSSMDEADRLFDKQLLDTARLIAFVYTGHIGTQVSRESTLAFQVWRQGKLIAASANAPPELLAPLVPGFGNNNFSGYRWRTVTHFDVSSSNWVVAAERSDLRYSLAENVVMETVFPILIVLPLIGLLIWFIVGQGLKPLSKLADELGNKQATDLSPLAVDSFGRELKVIVASSNELLERLERSLLREKQFASDAAHELRTPISVLKVQLHNLGELAPQANDNVLKLNETAKRLGHIVEQILDLYRISPDQYNASLAPLNLTGLVQEVLAREYSWFKEKDQKLEFQGKDCLIAGDQFAITTLLLNLFSNANKYTPVGGVIHVSTYEDEGRVILTVEDSGIGIPAKHEKMVFERFYRVGGDRHQSGEPGCGLGLAIVQHIVESHDATISVSHSSFVTGAVFKVSFPGVQVRA